jgi:GNAT superfamily N-acetyltransferase
LVKRYALVRGLAAQQNDETLGSGGCANQSGRVVRTMEPVIRPAERRDLDAIVEMAEARRVQYQEYQPVFWRKAEDSAEHAVQHLGEILGRDGVHVWVATHEGRPLGFLVAAEIRTPPVYEPGGPTYQIDDFCVSEPGLWPTVGRALLEEARAVLRREGVAQVVVVCGAADEPKSELLRSEELTIASNWWVTPL